MPKFWCVNFEDDAAFAHGIENKLWSMGYQYSDDDSANRIGRIRLNWQRLEKVKPGDKLIAYRKTNRFFAIGTVRTPRRTKTKDDRKDTISAYLDRRESYEDGYVYFTGTVVYENLTDDLDGYPVRIDVGSWDSYAPNGIVLPIVNKIALNERQLAVFGIEKADFDLIVDTLKAENGSASGNHGDSDVTIAEDATVVEALERSHARSQGFQIDSKTRKAIEHYAMQKATKHFTSKGYLVEDHHKNHPYDLLCLKKKERLYVEVKGTVTSGDGIILTCGEVKFARSHKGEMGLFILHSIQMSANGNMSDGKLKVIMPWDVDKGRLKPMSFMYEVP
jgi:hypothetical protein